METSPPSVPGAAASRKLRNPQVGAAQEGASRRVETGRHSGSEHVTVADEAVLCHVAHWLVWPDIDPLRTKSHTLLELIQHKDRWRASCRESGHIQLLRIQTASWRSGTGKRGCKRPEEQLWFSSPFGRPEKTRESWTCVLHSSTEHLPRRTSVPLPQTKPPKCDTLDEQQPSLTHSAGWTTRSSTTFLKWESLLGKQQGYALCGQRELFDWFSDQARELCEEPRSSPRSGGDSPVRPSLTHRDSPSSIPAHARVESLACSSPLRVAMYPENVIDSVWRAPSLPAAFPLRQSRSFHLGSQGVSANQQPEYGVEPAQTPRLLGRGRTAPCGAYSFICTASRLR